MTATTEPRTRSARGALAGLSLAMLLASLGTSVANVALPTLASAFGTSFQGAQWVVLAYLLASTTVIVSAGRLGDLIGRRRLLIAGIGVYTAASALAGAAPTLGALIAARGAQGVGAAIMMALSMALVAETVPTARMGRAMGLLGTTSAVGTALDPSLGGLLIASLGWRAIFLVTVPAGVAAALLVRRHLPAGARASERPAFDHRGTVLLALSLAAYTLAMTVNLALLGAAIAGAGLFLLAQTRTRSPLIRPAMLRSRRLSTGLATSGLVSTVMMTTLVVGPFYLTDALDLSAALVGLVMTIGPAVAALTGVPAGRLADRFGAPRAARVALAGIATGSVALAAGPATLAGFIAPIVVITASYAVFQTANNTSVMAGAGPEARGVTSGMLNLSRNLGLITGASVMGAVFSLVAGDLARASAGDVANGMHVTFVVAAALIAAALAITRRGPVVSPG